MSFSQKIPPWPLSWSSLCCLSLLQSWVSTSFWDVQYVNSMLVCSSFSMHGIHFKIFGSKIMIENPFRCKWMIKCSLDSNLWIQISFVQKGHEYNWKGNTCVLLPKIEIHPKTRRLLKHIEDSKSVIFSMCGWQQSPFYVNQLYTRTKKVCQIF